MKTILKTTAAAFVAFAAMTAAANAEDFALVKADHVIDNSAVLQNIYAAMELNQGKTFELVMANAQTRMEERLAAVEFKTMTLPTFTVASN